MTRALTSSRSQVWFLLLCVVLAIAVRIPSPPEPESAAPWITGALALQGLRSPAETGTVNRDLVVTVPLAVAQNLGYLVSKIGDADTGSRVAWIRESESFARHFLWVLWNLAGAAAALLATRLRPGGWGFLAGLAVAIVPIGLAGTERLSGWALAVPLALAAMQIRRSIPAVLTWSALLSLTPLGFVIAVVGLAFGDGKQRGAILLSLPLWFALDPSRLTSPGAAVSGIIPALKIAGWPGIGDGPAFRLITASWTPGLVAALLGLLGAAVTIRERAFRIAALVTLLLWWLPAFLGARRADAVGLAAPMALILSAEGARALVSRSSRGRLILCVVAAALILIPIGRNSARLLSVESTREKRTEQLAELLDVTVGSDGLLARDPQTPGPPDSINSFLFPTHVDRPELWDFAYWPGWYGPFTHMLFTARTLHRLEDLSADLPGARAMVLGLGSHAEPVAVIGDPATDRSALILFQLVQGPPWEPANRHELWDGLEGGPEEVPFLGDLAAFLTEHDQAERAIEVLRLALRWDEESPRLWNNLGATLLTIGEPAEAAEVLSQGLARNPSSVELRHSLAVAYIDMEVPARAVKELQVVLTARPNYGRAHYDLARAAASMKRWALTARALENYLAIEPDPPDRDAVVAALEEAKRLAQASR